RSAIVPALGVSGHHPLWMIAPSRGRGIRSARHQHRRSEVAVSLRARFFALTYDRSMAKTEKAGLHDLREELLAAASGRVLEIGAGTGANPPLSGPAVESLTVTEPEAPMLRRLERRTGEHAPRANLVRAPAEDLPFADDSFDAAVSTL